MTLTSSACVTERVNYRALYMVPDVAARDDMVSAVMLFGIMVDGHSWLPDVHGLYAGRFTAYETLVTGNGLAYELQSV